MEVAYWAIFLTVGGVYAVFLHGEYVVGNQLLLSVVLSRALRVVSFMTTTLPPPNPECRMRFSSAGDGGGCGDLLFSGHSTLVMTGICFVWSMDVRSVRAREYPFYHSRSHSLSHNAHSSYSQK